MIVHPFFAFDCNLVPRHVRRRSMWKKFLMLIAKLFVNYGPGVVDAVMEAKAKEAAIEAAKKAGQKPPQA